MCCVLDTVLVCCVLCAGYCACVLCAVCWILCLCVVCCVLILCLCVVCCVLILCLCVVQGGEKQEQLSDLLNNYSLNGLPVMPDLLNIGAKQYEDWQFQLEAHWQDIVEDHQVAPFTFYLPSKAL